MPVIPALGRKRQGDCEFEESLGCMARPWLKKTHKPNKQKRVRGLGM
jgi:hypothetical protein